MTKKHYLFVYKILHPSLHERQSHYPVSIHISELENMSVIVSFILGSMLQFHYVVRTKFYSFLGGDYLRNITVVFVQLAFCYIGKCN